MLTNATKRKIDTARDILVGKIPVPTSQVEQITLALVYKFMSDMDKKAKDLGDSSGFFANGYEKYSWGKLMDKALPARERVLLYREALEKMSLNPHIPQLFRDVFRDASLPFNDPETLKLFLDVIDQFEYDHSEELGNAFEYLLQVMGSQGDAGQFRTPRHIIDFIVDVVEPSKTDKILDPACGTAGFLISAYNHIKKKGLSSDEMTQLSENFVGYDISQDMQRLSLVNLYLHHFPNPHIFEYDTLSSEDRWNDNFDVILANPPFMTPKGGIRPHNRFSVPSKRAEVLFVDYIMEHLTARGKAGVIVPEGIIFQSQNAYKQLRKMMVEENYLWAVVSLPGGVFNPYSGVKTSILLFDREIAKKTDNILFVKVENDGFDLGAQRRESDKNDLPVAQELLLKYKKAILIGKKLSVDEVLELGGSTSDKKLMSSYGFDLDANSHIELSQLINQAYNEVSKDIIKKENFDLSSDRFVSKKDLNVGSWVSINLGELATVQRGLTYSSQDLSDENNGIPLYNLKSIKRNGDNQANDFKYFGGEIKEKHFVARNDILIALTDLTPNSSLIGSPKFINESIKAAYSADLAKVIINEDKIIPKFLYYLLRSDVYREHIVLYSNGTNVKHLKIDGFYNFRFPLPPISVQKQIVAEIDRYQKIIDGARQAVDNYQISFEVEDGWNLLEFENSPIEIEDGDRGTNYPNKKDFTDKGFCVFLNTKNVRPNGFQFDELEFIDQKRDNLLRKGKLKRNDIVLTTRGTVGNVGLYSSDVEFDNMRINSGMVIFRPDTSRILPKFLFFFLQSYYFKSQVQKMTSGSAQPQLPIRTIKRIQFAFPSIEEQAKIVSDIQDELNAIHSSSTLIQIFSRKIKARIESIWNK